MNRTVPVLCLVALLSVAQSCLALEIRGPEKVEPYKLVKLSVDLPADTAVIWDVFPDGAADADESVPGQLIFTGPPGAYLVKARVINFATKKIETARKTVTIGTPGPQPPQPPDPPKPTDPLVMALQAAYDSDTGAQKAAQLGILTGVMQGASDAVYLKDTSGNYLTTSHKQLADATHMLTERMVGAGQLPKTRAAVGVYLNANLPRQEAPMDEAARAKINAAYSKVAAALKGVRP